MKIIDIIRENYEQSGYVRVKMDHRREGVRSGWEVRVPFDDASTAARAARHLLGSNIRCGSTFEKRGRVVLPIYGKDRCEQFFKLVRPKAKDRLAALPDDCDLRLKPKR
ncbi:MAG TPA: hypothetical protein PLD59_05790 [Tepidisphaeraceae bacterium]|nr:hypothetical protein [Tepidisphaeraceae bacterium]